MRFRLLATAFLLLTAACSGSSSTETTATTAATTTSEATTTTVAETTTTTVAPTTTAETTTTTIAEDTTTTSEGEGGETTTTVAGDTTTTTAAVDETTTTLPSAPTTSSTTIPEADIDPDLVEWSGLFKQPTAYPGFIEFRADGVVRAGTSYVSLPFEGTWDYDEAASEFIFSNFDVGGTTCGGADGRYAQETARGGGRRLTLVEDPCTDRVNFLTQVGSVCQCMNWLRVDDPEE